MLEVSSIVKVAEPLVPDVGTLPVSVHPLHKYLVPFGPDTGEPDDTVMDLPASTHPLSGVCES